MGKVGGGGYKMGEGDASQVSLHKGVVVAKKVLAIYSHAERAGGGGLNTLKPFDTLDVLAMTFHASYSWNGPQIPKGCGCIRFLSPMHKKIPDSYSKREGGNPGNSGLSSQQ